MRAAGADRGRAGRGLPGGDEGRSSAGERATAARWSALFVGAVTVGSALPHLLAFFGGPDWRATVVATSALAALGGAPAARGAGLGPHHARAARLRSGRAAARLDRPAGAPRLRRLPRPHVGALRLLGLDRRGRCRRPSRPGSARARRRRRGCVTFAAIALGGAALPAGGAARRPDRQGAGGGAAMAVSGAAGLATARAFGGPVWLVAALVLLWGAAVIPDSAQFSALVADAAPASAAGSLLALQTAPGLHPHLLHGAGGAAGCRRPRLASHARASGARSRRGHRGDAPADAPDGTSGQRPDPILA